MIIRLAIVGSRNFTKKEFFTSMMAYWVLDHQQEPDLIISGGAKGVDTLAEEYAEEHQIPTLILKPDWKTHGKAAGPLRNTDIVNEATNILAFPSKYGRGTQDTIKKAEKAGKPLTVYCVD